MITLSRICTTVSLTATFAISSIVGVSKPQEAEAQQASRRPYAVFVNGYNDCCAWGMKEVQKQLQQTTKSLSEKSVTL